MSLPANIHPEEPGAVALLDQAIHALTTALDDMPIGDVVNLKAKIATIETATKQLGMSKEAQEYATEAVRRSEWALGRAIRRGQSDGTVGVPSSGRSSSDTGLPRPSDFASPSELYPNPKQAGIYDLADAAPTAQEFDAAIDEAKAEGNLSRANVARKAREAAGDSPKPRRRPLTDVAWDVGYDARKLAEKVQRLSDDDRFSANAEQVASHLRSHLTYAIEVYQDLLDRINNN